jgi:uncharacterized protein (DUF1800 family)
MAVSTSDAAHLLRRAGFTASQAQVVAASALSLPDLVEQVLTTPLAPVLPDDPAWVTTPPTSDHAWVPEAQRWWLNRMVASTTPLAERMTWFWHGHFATEVFKVYNRVWHLRMLRLFYDQGFGSFRDLCKAVSVEPLMLVYLDNNLNVKGKPNENFARELFELFMLGVDQYSQTDVAESARAWTGHTVVGTSYQFVAARHDTAPKTIFGTTATFNGPAVIDLVCDHPTKRMTMARHLAGKLWRYFAGTVPPPTVLTALAQAFLDGGLEVRELLRALFNRPEFYLPDVKAGLLRSPVDFVVASFRHTGLDMAGLSPLPRLGPMGQVPFSPPDVSGWGANEYWLATNFVADRMAWAGQVARRMRTVNSFPFSPNGKTVAAAVAEALQALGVLEPSDRTVAELSVWLADARQHGWDQARGLAYLILVSPEFQQA